MKIRKGNDSKPVENNQESDKVCIDGLMKTEDLVSYGQIAGMQTIEELRKLYPKNAEYEEREKIIMNDEELTLKLRAAGKDNDEKINAVYQNQKLKEKIRDTRDKINSLNKEYEQTHQENIIYQKNQKIRELENEIARMTQQP